MFPSKHFLKQGLQFGPWKVSRKVLLFIIAFSFVILAFGTLMLETHAFESDSYDRDDDDSYERDDDWDDDWELSGGDVTMIIVMCLAGSAILVSLFACCFAEMNPPSQFTDSGGAEGGNGGGQVFTIQLTKPSIGPQTSLNNQFYQYHQQQHQRHQQQFQQQQRANQAGNTNSERRNGSSQSRAERQGSGSTSTARAPYTSSRSPPPPYTQSDASPTVPPTSTTQEKPPPYSP